MGSPASTVLSHQDEYRLGAMVAKELRDQNALIEDPEVSEYINAVGDRLAAQSQDGARDFQFFVIKDSTINAFAVPGGYVFVHAGLFLATTSESELASVMAHEIAHVTQHHIARQLRAQSTQQMTSIAAMLGGDHPRGGQRRAGRRGRHRRRPGHVDSAADQFLARERVGGRPRGHRLSRRRGLRAERDGRRSSRS